GELPAGARVGTSSLRRRAFLARARPDAVPLELRGNVPTRIERLCAGDYDAIILAAAGLKRLGLHDHVTEYLPPEAFPPAVSQGVIGVCARTGDEPTLRWLAALDDGKARLAASAERALLRRLEGGCQVPLGALASGDQRSLELIACVCALDGSKALSASAAASAASGAGLSSADAAALRERVAADLLSRGAAGPTPRGPAWPAGGRVAARGKASAQVLRPRGWPVDLVPHEANAAALIATFAAQWQPSDAGVRVLYPASSRALPTIAAGLTQLGAQVTQLEAYRTEGSALDVDDCRAWIARGGVGAVTFASPSAL